MSTRARYRVAPAAITSKSFIIDGWHAVTHRAKVFHIDKGYIANLAGRSNRVGQAKRRCDCRDGDKHGGEYLKPSDDPDSFM